MSNLSSRTLFSHNNAYSSNWHVAVTEIITCLSGLILTKIIRVIKSRRLRWVGHAASIGAEEVHAGV